LQFNTAGDSEFQVRDAAVLKDRLANDVRRNSTHSSETDDDRVLLAQILSSSDAGHTRNIPNVGVGPRRASRHQLTSSTETNDVDDVMTMTGAPSSSSLSDLVAGCDVEFDSDHCIPPRANATAQQRLLWTARKHQRDAMLEPDVYYC